jgi:hypothetical protein
MYYGLVKPLPIMLGMLSESLLGGKLGESPNIVTMAKHLCSTDTFWSLLHVYDHHQKIMLYDAVKKMA